jgi:glutamate dehydrogenase
MSDIMLQVPGTVDLNGKQEIIFLGPDENSADLMEPACLFMKAKGYPYWKSITTGKPPKLGGIPHDVYGMTTRSVRAYVKGIQ